MTQFTASPSVLPDFERVLKLDEDLLRHLVVLSEGELPMPIMDVSWWLTTIEATAIARRDRTIAADDDDAGKK